VPRSEDHGQDSPGQAFELDHSKVGIRTPVTDPIRLVLGTSPRVQLESVGWRYCQERAKSCGLTSRMRLESSWL